MLSALIACAITAERRYIPLIEYKDARMYLQNMRDYAFLQYTQAGPDQARAAMLVYLGGLKRVQDEHIPYPRNAMHYDSGLAYLRLYRLESSVGNRDAADADMRRAQEEFSGLGWKPDQFSVDALIKASESREAQERKTYVDIGGSPKAAKVVAKGPSQ